MSPERSARGVENDSVSVERLETESSIAEARAVVDAVYVAEKGWMDEGALDGFPGGSSVSWYLARVDGVAAGLVRLVYDPPLDFPEGYDVRLEEGVDWRAVAANAKIVEVGRFMVLPQYRTYPRVVVKLMASVVSEVVRRGYSHLLTDVFEGEIHSPLHFHTRVLGFRPIGTHTRGEMRTDRRRIILALDIDEAYVRMRRRGGRFFEEFVGDVKDVLERRAADRGLSDS